MTKDDYIHEAEHHISASQIAYRHNDRFGAEHSLGLAAIYAQLALAVGNPNS